MNVEVILIPNRLLEYVKEIHTHESQKLISIYEKIQTIAIKKSEILDIRLERFTYENHATKEQRDSVDITGIDTQIETINSDDYFEKVVVFTGKMTYNFSFEMIEGPTLNARRKAARNLYNFIMREWAGEIVADYR